jgi:cation transport protein ChaC
MREMIGEAYVPTFRAVLTPQGPIEALAFVIDRRSRGFTDLSGAEAAAVIATGKGVLGTNLEYFNNLADRLAALGIADEEFEEIGSQLRRHG